MRMERERTFMDKLDLCKRGHIFTPDSTYIRPSGFRECKICKNNTRREWRSMNRDKHRISSKEWANKNKEKVAIKNKLWKLNNKETVNLYKKAYRHNRRDKLSSVKLNYKEWKVLLDLFAGLCPYCSTWGHELTVDHVVPVSKGGTNDINNLIPCCFKCNTLKGAKLLDEWLNPFTS